MADSIATASFPFTAERSRKLHAEAIKYLPGGTSRLVHDIRPHPLYVREGHGCYVVDVDGNRRLDFFNNASSLVHGHAHPEIVRAVVERVKKGSAFSLPSEEQVELAQILTERISSLEQVRFTNSGSEAVMFAVKAARAYTGRHKIAKFEGLYHGSYDWVEVSLDSDRSNMGSLERPASVPYNPGLPPGVLSDVVVLPFNDAQGTLKLIEAHKDELAAVLFDVMPNQIGLIQADPLFLASLREVTLRNGILLICDEVINFRLAYGGAQAFAGVDADLTTLGKIIGGGFPVGAVGGAGTIMEVFDASKGRAKVPHAGTFNANPVTLVAGVVSLRLLTAAEIARLNGLGELMRISLQEVFDKSGVPAHVTGAGSLFRIHMTAERFHEYRGWREHVAANKDAKRRQQQLYVDLLARGILLNPSMMGSISTPMTDRDVLVFVDAVNDAITSPAFAAALS